MSKSLLLYLWLNTANEGTCRSGLIVIPVVAPECADQIAAFDQGHNHQVAVSDRGYVLSFDITGTHTGDTDSNFWVLHAVKTEHTQNKNFRLHTVNER